MFEIEAWHWLAFGMVLILSELVVPSFTIIWFGLGALLTALLVWLVPTLSTSAQLFSWAVASIFFTVFWFLLIKPKMFDKTKAGIALEAVIGQSGLVIQAPLAGKRGLVKFTTPLLGAEEWQFLCREEVEIGARVTVIDVSGNTLVVKSNKGEFKK
jgi:hypothetical protein